MKLFRGFRQQLIHDKNLKKYLLYAIGEILLVMIGILLAFQVGTWNEDRIKKVAEIRTYENIREQILGDKRNIEGQINYNKKYMTQFEYGQKIIMENDRTQLDTLASIIRNLTNYSDFDHEGNIYETLVNSGKIQLLRNQRIVNRVRLLEQRYNYVNRMENISYEIMMGYAAPGITPVMNFVTAEIVNPERIFSNEFQNLFFLIIKM